MATVYVKHTQVVEIRNAFANGASVDDLCEQYGFDEKRIRSLLRGDTYKGVGGPEFPSLKRSGIQRYCVRCKIPYDDEQFAHLSRQINKGICKVCAKPGENFTEATQPRAMRLRQRQLDSRHRLQAELRALREAPFIQPLDPDERSRIRTTVMRSRLAWGNPIFNQR